MCDELESMSVDALILLSERINRILSDRMWKVGDAAYWLDRDRNVCQGKVCDMLITGCIAIKRKGELMWSTAIQPSRAYRSFEAATRAARGY